MGGYSRLCGLSSRRRAGRDGRRAGGSSRPPRPHRADRLAPASGRAGASCRRGLPAAIAAGLAALALAGCGARSGGLDAVVSAAALTLSRTAATTSTLSGAVSFGTGRTPLDARGAFVFPSGLGYEAVALPGGAGGAAPAVYLVFLPKTVYLGSLPGVTPRFVEQVEGLNPRLVLDEISWGATAATFIGHRVTDHVPYSDYSVSISLRRALAGADSHGDGAMSLAIKDELSALAGGARGPASVPVEAWVDGPGRIAELRAAIPGSGLGTVTIVLSSFGTPIPSNLPLRSQTLAISSIAPSSRSPWVFGGGT
jgi:hypothetical protein